MPSWMEYSLKKKSVALKSAANPKALSRREQYAEETRHAILMAARDLFSRQGYFSTTVDQIAEVAKVAPITVYVSAGGKSGLLRSLTEMWSSSPLIETNYRIIQKLKDPEKVLRVVANTARRIREEFGDIVFLMLATAPHDPDVADNLSLATSRYRQAIQVVVQHLVSMRALRRNASEAHAADVLWFYFGYWGLYTLHIENGWDFDRAEDWLYKAAVYSILKPKPIARPVRPCVSRAK